jgi:hypothetical protein
MLQRVILVQCRPNVVFFALHICKVLIRGAIFPL